MNMLCCLLSLEVPENTFRSHPLRDLEARALPYKESWRRRIRRRQHINIIELESYVSEEKRICQRTCSKRVEFGLDSQVSLGALKCRAASPRLNSLLRCALAYPIGSDIYSLPMYFSTSSNRAGGPTRDSEPLPPDLPLPDLWGELGRGEYAGFDAWMRLHGTSDPENDIPFGDIAGDTDLDLLPNRRERSKRFFKVEPREQPQTSKPAVCESSLFFLMIFPASLVRVLLICLVVAMVWQNKQLVQELPGSPLTSGTALLLRIS